MRCTRARRRRRRDRSSCPYMCVRARDSSRLRAIRSHSQPDGIQSVCGLSKKWLFDLFARFRRDEAGDNDTSSRSRGVWRKEIKKRRSRWEYAAGPTPLDPIRMACTQRTRTGRVGYRAVAMGRAAVRHVCLARRVKWKCSGGTEDGQLRRQSARSTQRCDISLRTRQLRRRW